MAVTLVQRRAARAAGRRLAVSLAIAALALASVAGLVAAPPALAHTELVSWSVEPDAAAGADRLRLRFSEPIDGRFLTVSLLDMTGAVVESGGVAVDQQRRTDGLVSLKGVAAGVYTVAWWTRALDGDPSNGSFILGYKSKAGPADLLPPIGARDPATQPAMFWEDTVWDTLLHWWAYLGSALLLGGLGFSLIVWRPAWGRFTDRMAAADGGAGAGAGPAAIAARERLDHLDWGASRAFRLVALAGAGVFVATSLVLLVLQVGFVRYSLLQPVTSSAPTPLAPSGLSHQTPIHALGEILSGYNGRVWIARMVTGIAALLLAILPGPARRRENWRWLLAFVVGAGAVFTVSLSAHAAVIPESSWARFLDWAHLVVMSVWIGGLLPLILTVRRIRREYAGQGLSAGLASEVSKRFSAFALGAFVFMAVTGAAAGFLHVGSFGLLTPTIYGRALIAKLALFGALFVFGAVHRRWSLARLAPDLAAGRRRTFFERLLPFEFAVGIAVMVSVALMASLGTSKSVWPAHERLGYYTTVDVSAVSATVRAVPGTAGENAVALDVVDRRLGQPTTGTRATITIGGRQMELLPVGTPSPGSPQRFAAAALSNLAESAGPCAFSYERPSYAPVRGTVEVRVQPAPQTAAPRGTVPATGASAGEDQARP